MNTNSVVKIIDKALFVFIFLFLASLTNSIFVNQIGYFGALLLLIIRFALNRENKLKYTGLELAFALFILVEFISAILSVNKPAAFNNLLKRFLLIPVFYTVIASAGDLKTAKLFVKIYLGAAFITIMAYIIFSYEHFVAQLYQIEAKGPSPFQYVMTAGGLISFTAVYFFAFFMNEKTKPGYKFLLGAAFAVSVTALFASYTRAAWLGAGVGILLILILKQKYVLIALGAAVIVIMLFMKQNSSELITFRVENNNLIETGKISTEGRARGFFADSLSIILADYENGILNIANRKITSRIATPAPAVWVSNLTGDLILGVLVDQRMLLLRRTADSSLTALTEFASPGILYDADYLNGKLYTADVDSGLTVFDIMDIRLQKRFPEYSGFRYFSIDTIFLAGYNLNDKEIKFYSVKEGLPHEFIFNYKIETTRGNIWLHKGRVIFTADDALKIFSVKEKNLKLEQNFPEMNSVDQILFTGDTVFASSLTGDLFIMKTDSAGNLYQLKRFMLGYQPGGAAYLKGMVYVSRFNRNRILSVADPYHMTNIERINQWKTGIRILKDYPLFGVGDIDLKPVYKKYKHYYEKYEYGHLHNNFIHVLVILGGIGLCVFLFLLIKIYLLNIKIYRALKGRPFVSSFALGTLAAFTAFIFTGLAEWNFGDQEIITMVWFSLGINFALYNLAKNEEQN